MNAADAALLSGRRHLYDFGMEGAFTIFAFCGHCGRSRLGFYPEGLDSGVKLSECSTCRNFSQVFSSVVLATEN